jgi:hypothetical protein
VIHQQSCICWVTDDLVNAHGPSWDVNAVHSKAYASVAYIKSASTDTCHTREGRLLEPTLGRCKPPIIDPRSEFNQHRRIRPLTTAYRKAKRPNHSVRMLVLCRAPAWTKKTGSSNGMRSTAHRPTPQALLPPQQRRTTPKDAPQNPAQPHDRCNCMIA